MAVPNPIEIPSTAAPPVAAVVPASFVVASTRADYPLTEAGLLAAIAALPAEGGEIWIGPGAGIIITAPIAISKDIKLVGAGIGSAIIAIDPGIVAFVVGGVNFTVEDLQFDGDASAGQTFIQHTGVPATSDRILLTRVLVDGVDIVCDQNATSHSWKVTDSILIASGASALLSQGSVNGEWDVVNSRLEGEAEGVLVFLVANSTIISATTTLFGSGTKLTNCIVNTTGGATFNLDCQITGGRILGDVTAGNLCRFANCSIENDIIAAGVQLSVVGCNLETFSSDGFNNHIIQGNVFEGGATTVTLDDSSGCVVTGNVNCLVLEAGTANSNQYAGILPTSTLIGALSVVNDAQRFAWASPDVLTITDNAFFARFPVQVEQGIRLLSVEVETAPTGAALLVDFRLGTRATGVLDAAFATVTVAIGAFTGSAVVAGITILPTQFVVCEITQVGSTIAGANATMVARA